MMLIILFVYGNYKVFFFISNFSLNKTDILNSFREYAIFITWGF